MSSLTASPGDRLAATLRELDLLLPEQAPALEEALASCGDARSLARTLIQQGCLTPFQANQLLQDKGRALVLGPYALLDRVGAGGMGEVFKARHRRLHRIAAVKVIGRDKLANPVARGRFVREWEAAAQLSHPNIVAVFDAGEEGDTLYLAMELVDGIDLGRLVQQEGPLPVALAADFARQAARGLAHAHALGYVHRDIKPQNLLAAPLGGMGRGPAGYARFAGAAVKVLDMGLVRMQPEKVEEAQLALTQQGIVIGTVDYCAPEQARNSRNVDGRADLYALGCTVYHLLAGEPPFRGGTALDKLLRHQTDIAPPLRQRRPDVPAALERVVARMMAKNPDDRHGSAEELADDLARFSAGDSLAVPVMSGPASLSLTADALAPTRAVAFGLEPAPPSPGRRWWWAGGAASLGLLLCLLLAKGGKQPGPEAEAKPPEKKPEPPPKAKPKADADFDRYFPPGTAAVIGVQPRQLLTAPILKPGPRGFDQPVPLDPGVAAVLKLAGADLLEDVDHLRLYYPSADPLESTWLARGRFDASAFEGGPGLRPIERDGQHLWRSESPAAYIGQDNRHLFVGSQSAGVASCLAHASNPAFAAPAPDLWEAFSGTRREKTLWLALAPRRLGKPASWGKDRLLGALLDSVFAEARVVSGWANVGGTLNVSFTFACHDESAASRLAARLGGYKTALWLGSFATGQTHVQKVWTALGANAAISCRMATVTLSSNLLKVPAS